MRGKPPGRRTGGSCSIHFHRHPYDHPSIGARPALATVTTPSRLLAGHVRACIAARRVPTRAGCVRTLRPALGVASVFQVTGLSAARRRRTGGPTSNSRVLPVEGGRSFSGRCPPSIAYFSTGWPRPYRSRSCGAERTVPSPAQIQAFSDGVFCHHNKAARPMSRSLSPLFEWAGAGPAHIVIVLV
jgi:hypothetical protein